MTCNGSFVPYTFLNLEMINDRVLAGILYIGEKLVDFEINVFDILYNTFTIEKYTFLVKSSEAMTVFVAGDEANTVPLQKWNH